MEHQCDLLSPVLTNIQPNCPNSVPRSLPAQHGLMPMADPNEGLKKTSRQLVHIHKRSSKVSYPVACRLCYLHSPMRQVYHWHIPLYTWKNLGCQDWSCSHRGHSQNSHPSHLLSVFMSWVMIRLGCDGNNKGKKELRFIPPASRHFYRGQGSFLLADVTIRQEQEWGQNKTCYPTWYRWH